MADEGHEQSPFAQLYSALPPTPEGRTLIVSRHGESLYNLEDRIGGNPRLSPRGEKYAVKLAEHVNGLGIRDMNVWCSELQRTHQTAAGISATDRHVRPELNELSSGDFDDLTYDEFESAHPEEFQDRIKNKLTFRYPGGESYLDVCARLSAILPELDRAHNNVVIAHQATLRCVFGFLNRTPAREIPYIKVPLHTVITFRFVGGQNVMSSQKLDVACVDTYKPKQGPIADSVSEMKNTNTDKDVNMNLWGNSIIGGEQEVRS